VKINKNITEEWLRKNDPLYGKKGSSYLTHNRFLKIQRREKPFGPMNRISILAERRRVVT